MRDSLSFGKETLTSSAFAVKMPFNGFSLVLPLTWCTSEKESLNKTQQVIVDLTVQQKNISLPTDAKRYCKVIGTCNGMAKRLGIGLRQSYTFSDQASKTRTCSRKQLPKRSTR